MDDNNGLPMWPHQSRAIDETLAAIYRGERRILVTSPTGGGKTRMMTEIAKNYLRRGRKVVLYSNRKMLIDQLSSVLNHHGLDHGIRAAGYEDERYFDLQVSSIQTEHSRVTLQGTWDLHAAELVLVDEAHLQTAAMAKQLLEAHYQEGAIYVGFTATPLDLAHLYDILIVAGTNSELRGCGALVPAYHYGPDEPDLKHIGRVALGQDLTEQQNVKAMMTPTIFGRVIKWWEKLNPEAWPTLLFGPGVPHSIGFAEQFQRRGITAAHIDGAQVWVRGELMPSTREVRAQILNESKKGEIKIICNRFVLREGIDAPWLQHCILATVFGSLQSYLQSGGRLLRAYPGIGSVIIQDHGGNWWRHGSLNSDRQWELEYTAATVSGLREERMRAKKEPEPVLCPQCGLVLASSKCPCGFNVQSRSKSRPVIQSDGTMKEMHGDIFRPRRLYRKPEGPDIWKRMYYRSKTKTGARTFRAAAALFALENNYSWPDPSWPFMPTKEIDMFRLVADVPEETLTQ